MNLEDLRSAQTRERATDGLQELRDSFYGDVADYIAELKDQRDAAASAADDPFGDPEVQELTDKIETAEQVAEAIYERRMGKLVKQASLAAAGMPDDAQGLTDEERALYGDLVDRIEANKSHVLDVISGEADTADGDFGGEASQQASGSAADAATERAPGADSQADAGDASAAAAMGGGLDADEAEGQSADAETPPEPGVDGGAESESADGDAAGGSPADAGVPDAVAEDLARVKGDDDDADDANRDATDGTTDGGDVERTTVRVTDDVGDIFGMDEREYTLEAEDVVTLPAENAEPLVEKGAAEKID